MSDIYYDNDGDLNYHPLESLNLIDKASEKPTRETAPTAYISIFQKHPTHDEHHIYRRKANIESARSLGGSTNSISSGFEPHTNLNVFNSLSNTNTQMNTQVKPEHRTVVKEHVDEATSFLKGALKEGSKFLANDKEIVTESLDQHKYARLANSSYDYFNSKGDIDAVHSSLKDPNYNYIEDLKDFEVDKELSTIDNLILHNSNTGETCVSYRGTTDNPGRTKTFLKDWKVNGEIAGGSTHTTRIKQADKQIDRVIAKYGKKDLSVAGHSQGAHVSYEIASKNDLKGHHYNPAINSTQVKKAGQYAANEAEQTIYKTATDFASPMAYHKKLKASKTTVKIVNNLENMDGVVQTHSIDQFAPKPKSVVGAVVKAERRTLAGSVMKSAGKLAEAANIGLAAYQEEKEIDADLNNKNSNTYEKIADVSIDTTKNAEKFLVDNAIADAGLALAGETFGASVVVSVGAVMLNDFVADHVAVGAKDLFRKGEVAEKSVEHSFKKAGRSIKRFFTHW